MGFNRRPRVHPGCGATCAWLLPTLSLEVRSLLAQKCWATFPTFSTPRASVIIRHSNGEVQVEWPRYEPEETQSFAKTNRDKQLTRPRIVHESEKKTKTNQTKKKQSKTKYYLYVCLRPTFTVLLLSTCIVL